MKPRRFGLWIILFSMTALLFRSRAMQAGVRAAIPVCGQVLIPALFPFSVLSSLLLRAGGAETLGEALDRIMRRWFCLPGQAAVPLLTGLLGGYPIGAHSLSALCKQGVLRPDEAQTVSAFCNHPGPAFLIGAVGASVLGDGRRGLWLWFITVLSALLTGLLWAPRRQLAPRRSAQVQEAPLLPQIPAAVFDGVTALLRVCGNVVLFSGLQAAILPSDLPVPPWAGALITGTLELTTGVLALQPLPRPLAFLLAAVLTGWGGCCVHLQAADALLDAGLPLGRYLAGKATQAAISGLLAFALLPLLYPESAASRMGLGAVSVAGLLGLLTFFAGLQKSRWKSKADVL